MSFDILGRVFLVTSYLVTLSSSVSSSWPIFGTFSTTESGGRLGCKHRMSLECLAIRWHKS
jgi:hypothetical protein